jgi:hypothetical protein
MELLSIDIGIKNLSFCLFKIKNKEKEVLDESEKIYENWEMKKLIDDAEFNILQVRFSVCYF